MSKVTKNIIYNGLGQGLSVALGFVAVRYVFRQLGGDALGLVYFSLAFSSALTVAVQLGVCESAVREVASHKENRPEYIESFIQTSSLLYWTSYLLLAIIAYIAAPYLVHHWVKIETLDPWTAIKVMRILSLGAMVALPGGLYRALLTGLQHMGLTNVIDVGGKALQQGGIFLILLIHGNIFHVAYWIAASTVLPVAVYWVVCSRYFSLRALFLPGFSREVVKENFTYASGLMTITICSWILGQADRVIISKLLPLTLLGIYTFARSAVSQGQLLTGAINGAVFPHFSSLHGAGKMEELKAAYNKIHDLICFGTVPVFAGVPFVAIPIFSRVFDAHSAHLLLLPSTFLCIGIYMNGTLTAPYVLSLAVGRPDIAARQNLAALFVVVPASAIAIYLFGLNGAGFSVVIYGFFTYAYGLPRICRECLGMSVSTWYWNLLKIMSSAFIVYGAAWALAAAGHFKLVYLAGAYLLGTIIYCAFSLWLLGPELRGKVMDLLKLRGVKTREVLVSE